MSLSPQDLALAQHRCSVPMLFVLSCYSPHGPAPSLPVTLVLGAAQIMNLLCFKIGACVARLWL